MDYLRHADRITSNMWEKIEFRFVSLDYKFCNLKPFPCCLPKRGIVLVQYRFGNIYKNTDISVKHAGEI